MRTHNNEPLYIFKDVLSTGIDLISEGSIFAILEGNNFALYEHRTNSAAVVATTTIADYLAIVPKLYDELPLSDGLRTTYVLKQDMIDEPITKDFQLAKCQDTLEEFIFSLEVVDANAPVDWIRDTSDTGYFKPVVSAEGLRRNTVADETELRALVVDNNTKTAIEGGFTYVFRKMAAGAPKIGIPDDAGTGEWLISVDATYEIKVDPTTYPLGLAVFDFKHPEPMNIDFLDLYINGAFQNDKSIFNIDATGRIITFAKKLSRKTEVRVLIRSKLN